jgi:hypothetical protein
MKKFIYTSSTPCHVTLLIDKENKHISLFENEIYELPENDPFVKSLLAQGLLQIQKTIKK